MKHTVYIGIEVEAGSKMEATAKTIQYLSVLNSEAEVGESQVFIVDDRPLKKTTGVITFVLHELMKIENLTNDDISAIFGRK